jgi:hypothetical protein
MWKSQSRSRQLLLDPAVQIDGLSSWPDEEVAGLASEAAKAAALSRLH